MDLHIHVSPWVEVRSGGGGRAAATRSGVGICTLSILNAVHSHSAAQTSGNKTLAAILGLSETVILEDNQK